MAKISDLMGELVARVSALPEFQDRSFSIYNLDDFTETTPMGYPMVGVAYEGSDPSSGNQGSPVASKSCAVSLLTARFSVILATEYTGVNSVDDTKVSVMDLMDAIKQSIMGYQGVNNRPWVFSGESPVMGGLEGVIFYGQLWQTDIPVIGTSQHP